jgi:CTP:molybdopterin cytidylyltransferase MocA
MSDRIHCELCPCPPRRLTCLYVAIGHPFCERMRADPARWTAVVLDAAYHRASHSPPPPIPPARPSPGGGRWPGPDSGWVAPPGDGRVTVIIPTRDRPHLVGRAIESVLAQTRKPARIIVVKNGAGHFREYLDAFGGRVIDPQFFFLWRDDLSGIAASINAGLEVADTEHVMVVDDDDALEPEAIEKLAGALDADRTLGLAYGDASHPRGPDEPIHRSHALAPPPVRPLVEALTNYNWVGWSQAVWRRECLAGGLSPEASGCADWDAWLRISRSAGAYHVPEALAAHYWHGGNASNDRAWFRTGCDWVREGIAAGRYGHQEARGATSDAEVVRSLTEAQRAALASCGRRHEVGGCCGPRTICELGRIQSEATATADCARCVTADLPR